MVYGVGGCANFQPRATEDTPSYDIAGALIKRNVMLALCRKALRAQAQALAEQPFSREAYARDPKQARTCRLAVCLWCIPPASA